ncbi:hypothetical protein ACOM2C_05475 [Pseudarthrobacter sp. So.54]
MKKLEDKYGQRLSHQADLHAVTGILAAPVLDRWDIDQIGLKST